MWETKFWPGMVDLKLGQTMEMRSLWAIGSRADDVNSGSSFIREIVRVTATRVRMQRRKVRIRAQSPVDGEGQQRGQGSARVPFFLLENKQTSHYFRVTVQCSILSNK
jgi:hypothetical protein